MYLHFVVISLSGLMENLLKNTNMHLNLYQQ